MIGFLFSRENHKWIYKLFAQLPAKLPVLLALYSLVTLLATRLVQSGVLPIRQAAWYRKTLPTFSDALAAVRRHWWRSIGLSTSTREDNIIKVPRRVFQRLHEAACYAA